LLDLYQKFGATVLLDPVWDVSKIGRCSKTFHSLLGLLYESRTPDRSQTATFKRIVQILSGGELDDNVRRLLENVHQNSNQLV